MSEPQYNQNLGQVDDQSQFSNQQYAEPNQFNNHNSARFRDSLSLMVEELSRKSVNAIRAVFGIVGAVAVIIGLALLVMPGKTLIVFTVALGIYFIVSGVVRLITSLVAQGMPGGWRVLGIIVGLLLTIGGIVIIKNTALSASTLLIMVTLIVGIGWIMEGVMTLAETWAVPYNGWAIFNAVVSIIAGICILISPLNSTLVLVIFGGCALLILGITSLIRAFTFGKNR